MKQQTGTKLGKEFDKAVYCYLFYLTYMQGVYVCVCMRMCVLSCFSHVQLFATLWTIAHQTPLSMGFSKQEYWNGLPFPSPGDLPSPGIEPVSPEVVGRFLTTVPRGKPMDHLYLTVNTMKNHQQPSCER